MRTLFFSVAILCIVSVAGCGKSKDNALATDGATADDFAQYEADLAAVSGGDSYEDGEAGDDDADE